MTPWFSEAITSQMDSTGQTRWAAIFALAGALIWAGANILFMKHIGNWLVFSGGACVALAVAVWLATALGRVRARSLLSNLLLVVTLINFNAWAFSHLANLFFYLGLFFFMLFALIMGSTLFRFLSGLGRVSKRAATVSGALCVLLSWGGGFVLEASYLPQDTYMNCLPKRLPSGLTRDDLRRQIHTQARQFLTDRYGSSMTLAYLRWELDGGEMHIALEGVNEPLVYIRSQRRIGFALRLVLSLALVVYGVFSQIAALHKKKNNDPSGEISDAEHKSPEVEPHLTAGTAIDS